MAGLVIVLVLVAVVIAWFTINALREKVQEREQVDEVLHDREMPTLEYSVPTGQDPVVILAALERAGYTATADPNHAHQRVFIACPDGVERHRAHVRSVIESANVTTPQHGVPMQNEVRFRDEQ
jgi:hypothetical protein